MATKGSAMSDDTYQDIGYGAMEIGFGERPGVLVVDFQTGFTQPEFPLGNCPLVHRAVENTARVLEAARAARVPVANCYTAYHSEGDMPYWKIAPVRESFFEGDPCAEMEPRTSDPDYDYILRKSGPSIFFQTPVTAFLTKHSVDTTIGHGLHDQRLHPGVGDRFLLLRLPHHGAGGLRGRRRRAAAPRQSAGRRPPLCRHRLVRARARLPRRSQKAKRLRALLLNRTA